MHDFLTFVSWFGLVIGTGLSISSVYVLRDAALLGSEELLRCTLHFTAVFSIAAGWLLVFAAALGYLIYF